MVFLMPVYFTAVPGQPNTNVDSTTATSISVFWINGSVVDNYGIIWQRDTSAKCPDDEDEGSVSLTGGSTSYDIMGLEEDSSYKITVTASNAAGSSAVMTTAMTLEAGQR